MNLTPKFFIWTKTHLNSHRLAGVDRGSALALCSQRGLAQWIALHVNGATVLPRVLLRLEDGTLTTLCQHSTAAGHATPPGRAFTAWGSQLGHSRYIDTDRLLILSLKESKHKIVFMKTRRKMLPDLWRCLKHIPFLLLLTFWDLQRKRGRFPVPQLCYRYQDYSRLQGQMGKKQKKEEIPSQLFFLRQHQMYWLPWATESLWLNKWLFPEWWFKQMSEYVCQGIKNNSSLSCNNSTAVSPCLPVPRLAEMLCSKAYVSVQYLPWKPSWGVLDFLSAGLCALYLWYHPPVPGHFLSRCLTVGYSTDQLKQHLEKTNYIRNRTSVFSLLSFTYCKFQACSKQLQQNTRAFLLKSAVIHWIYHIKCNE